MWTRVDQLVAFGTLSEGAFDGKKYVISPRTGLRDSEAFIEKTTGQWDKVCLACEAYIVDHSQPCPTC